MKVLPPAVVVSLLLTSCGQPSAQPQPAGASARPDIELCDANHVQAEGAGENLDPVEIPNAFRKIAKASAKEMAILTRDRATICVNLSWVSSIHGMEWLKDDRLLGWAWDGYEAFGYQVADRVGRGTVVETGGRPEFSPSGARLAAVQVSEAEWGGLEGFAVWDVRDTGIVELGRDAMDDDFRLPEVFAGLSGEWSIARWHDEDCVALVVAPYDETGRARSEDAQPFHAAQSNGWQVKSGECS